jgi:hypothetical protein
MADAMARNEFVSLRGITGTFPANNRQAIQAYAQSHSLVRYIIDRWGASAITSLLDAYAEGVTDGDAVGDALGVTLTELEEDWLASLGVERPSYAALAEPAPPAVASPTDVAASELPAESEPSPATAVLASAAAVPAVVAVLVLYGRHRARGGSRST